MITDYSTMRKSSDVFLPNTFGIRPEWQWACLTHDL